jgi:hypothetical protein
MNFGEKQRDKQERTTFFLFEYICLIHKHIFFLGTCNLLSIDQLNNDETGYYKFTCTFAKLKFWRGFLTGIYTCSAGETLKFLNFLSFISTWHVENCQMQRDGKRLE